MKNCVCIAKRQWDVGERLPGGQISRPAHNLRTRLRESSCIVVTLLFLGKLLPRIVKAPHDQLTLCHRTQLFRLVLELIVEEVQSRSPFDHLD